MSALASTDATNVRLGQSLEPTTSHREASEQRLTEILTEVGQAAKDANRVEVSFATIAPDEQEFWSERSDNDLHVAIGRMGATRLRSHRIRGRGISRSRMIAAATGGCTD